MKNLMINSIAITDTEEFKTLRNKSASLYNELMDKLSRKDKYKLKELVETIEKEERLFQNSVEFNGRLYKILLGGSDNV
jgi:ribosomal protein L1